MQFIGLVRDAGHVLIISPYSTGIMMQVGLGTGQFFTGDGMGAVATDQELTFKNGSESGNSSFICLRVNAYIRDLML